MPHTYPLKEIALQAGVGLATVDRVIHHRGGVRPGTEQRIRQAMDELARQTLQATLGGRRLVIDLVMDAPARFSGAVQSALEAELPALLPASFRVRAHLSERASAPSLAATLERIGRRGSHGILLKAPDDPAIRRQVETLAAMRIPTVTLVTDVPDTPRIAYVGMDNHAAGQTAAWLVASWLGVRQGAARPDGRPAVLVALSSHRFVGEEQREAGFRAALAQLAPHVPIVSLSEGRGIDRETAALTQAVLAARPDVAAVYSIGGGNRAIVQAFGDAGRPCHVFIGHDLDSDNRRLLTDGMISAVLNHDLQADMRLACRLFLQAHRILPKAPPVPLSAASIVTRFNMPPDAAAQL